MRRKLLLLLLIGLTGIEGLLKRYEGGEWGRRGEKWVLYE
jgi:hypothetical protein